MKMLFLIWECHLNHRCVLIPTRNKQLLTGVPNTSAFLSDWLSRLPQRNYVDVDDAKKWHKEVSENEGALFAWHFKNLSGLSAEESGDIAQRAMGHGEITESTESIISRKLLKAPPVTKDVFMRRERLSLQMTASIFKEDFGAVSRDSVTKEIASHRLGWMSSMPDDVVEIEGVFGAVDYKSPTVVPVSTEIAYQSKLQIHDYLLADSRGCAHMSLDDLSKRFRPLVFDFMLDVYLDFANGEVKVIDVPYSGKLMRTIIEAGDAVWMHVSQGDPLPVWLSSKS